MSTNRPPLDELSPGLSRDKLLCYLTEVLNLAERILDRLDNISQYWDDQDSVVRLADKIVTETALLILLVSRAPKLSNEMRSKIATLTQQLSLYAYGERTRALLMRFPWAVGSHGLAPLVLSHLGEGDETVDALVWQALDSGHVDAVERLPYRDMDVRWVRSLMGSRPQFDFEDLLPQSILTSSAHPIYMTRGDTYALTHALMYVTDFGTLPLPTSVDPDRIAEIIDAGLACHIMSEDLDLLGELLLCAAFLRRPWSPYGQFAWHLLAKTWDELSFLPGPSFEASAYRSLEAEEASAYAFRHLYHTNYVGGILCATLLLHPETSGHDSATWNAYVRIDSDLIRECEVRKRSRFSGGVLQGESGTRARG